MVRLNLTSLDVIDIHSRHSIRIELHGNAGFIFVLLSEHTLNFLLFFLKKLKEERKNARSFFF